MSHDSNVNMNMNTNMNMKEENVNLKETWIKEHVPFEEKTKRQGLVHNAFLTCDNKQIKEKVNGIENGVYETPMAWLSSGGPRGEMGLGPMFNWVSGADGSGGCD